MVSIKIVNKKLKFCKKLKVKQKEKIDLEIKAKYKKLRQDMKLFKPVKNNEIKDFELSTPKDIKACAVKRCCDAYTSGFSNLRNGNIKFFNLKYKKKKT